MSVTDDINKLRQIAGRIPVAHIRQIQQILLELNAELVGVLGPNFGMENSIRERSSAADIRLSAAVAACQDFQDIIQDVAASIERAGG